MVKKLRPYTRIAPELPQTVSRQVTAEVGSPVIIKPSQDSLRAVPGSNRKGSL